MKRGPSVLKVYEVGKNILVGFSRNGVLLKSDIPRWHKELVKLADEHDCEVLTFDLTDVKKIPNAVLDIMYALDKRGVQVQVFNPSDHIRDLFKVTRLDDVVAEVDSPYAAEST